MLSKPYFLRTKAILNLCVHSNATTIIIIISLMNVLLSLNLRKLNPEANFGLLYATPTVIVALDLLLKLVGLLISVTIFPAAMVLSILLASLLLIFFPKSA
ncbi:hypothetical protein FAM3257_02106 [Lacticaseibacillus paracasei]|nr:hypothetical protein FAM3257_02106 [Lacticaseibacillus paracasei]